MSAVGIMPKLPKGARKGVRVVAKTAKRATNFEAAYEQWRTGRALMKVVDASPNTVKQSWVDRNVSKANALMESAARRMSSTPAKSAADIARKLEIFFDHIAYNHGQIDSKQFLQVAKSARRDVRKLAAATRTGTA